MDDVEKAVRRGALFLILTAIVLGLLLAYQPAFAQSKPTIKLTIARVTDQYSVFRVEGTAKNLGPREAAFSPSIRLVIYTGTGQDLTLVGSATTWPVGQFLTRMNVGESAAFSIMASVPDYVKTIAWSVFVKEYPFGVSFLRKTDRALYYSCVADPPVGGRGGSYCR
jgi:hypothetical protein